jgi:hypothetical protein
MEQGREASDTEEEAEGGGSGREVRSGTDGGERTDSDSDNEQRNRPAKGGVVNAQQSGARARGPEQDAADYRPRQPRKNAFAALEDDDGRDGDDDDSDSDGESEEDDD